MGDVAVVRSKTGGVVTSWLEVGIAPKLLVTNLILC
jgi:hypothetical protein